MTELIVTCSHCGHDIVYIENVYCNADDHSLHSQTCYYSFFNSEAERKGQLIKLKKKEIKNMKLEIFDKPVSQDKVVNLRLSKNSSGSNVILEAVDQEGKLITQILEINSGSGWGNDGKGYIVLYTGVDHALKELGFLTTNGHIATPHNKG